MRTLLDRIALAFDALQGVVGVSCLGVGAYLIAGLGWGLVVLGTALLVAAAVRS